MYNDTHNVILGSLNGNHGNDHISTMRHIIVYFQGTVDYINMTQVVTTDTNDCTEIMVYGLPYVFDRTGTCNLFYLELFQII
jgi:hypothetical protein